MLYDILGNRACVNILKKLYDLDVEKKYSVKISELGAVPYNSIITLKEHDLVLIDKSDSDEVVSITYKGKQFIEQFDRLHKVLVSKEQPRSLDIVYDLSDAEKKLLIVLFRVERETGMPVSLQLLTRELFPYQDYNKKKQGVAKLLNKLVELNLAEKRKDGREVYSKTSQSGIRILKEQILNTLELKIN